MPILLEVRRVVYESSTAMATRGRWIDRDRNFKYQLPLIFVAINEISIPQSFGGTRASKCCGE